MCVRSQVLLPLGLVVAIFATEAAAEPRLTCGSFHTVTRGETLFKIAERAYGDGWLYEKIFEANRDLLPDEGSLEIGYELLIPCLDGAGPTTRREAMAKGPLAPAARDGAAMVGPAASSEEPNELPGRPAQDPVAATLGRASLGNSCATFHTVARGETLFKIAERAYGDGWLYEKIFEANRDLLPDEGSLEIGYELLIPCLDGSGPKTRREAMTSAAQDPANLSGQGEATERETTAHAVESAADKREGLTRLLGRTQEIAVRALLPHSAFGQPFTLETDSFGVEALQRRVADKAVQPEASGSEAIEDASANTQTAQTTYVSEGDGLRVNAPDLAAGRSVAQEAPSVSAKAQGASAAHGERRDWSPNQPVESESLAKTDAVATDLDQLREHPDQLVRRSQVATTSGKPVETLNAPHAAPAVSDARALAHFSERTQPMEASISAMADLTSEPPSAVQPLRLLTVSGIAPFAGQELPEGGMIPELVTRSIEAADATTRYLVSFESDRSAHLRMQPHAFDLSFPWHKPDCGELQEMSEEGRILCTNFEFSRPFIEEAIGFYVRAGGSLVAAHEHTALEDRRICRPKAAPVIGIDQVDLGLAHSSIESPDMAFVCWAKLIQGEVDVVMVLKRQARQYLRQLGIANEVAEAEQLAVTRMLYGIVPRLNPRAEQVLDLINQGLDHVMLSGQWFNVVAFHNSRQTELLN